MVFLNEWLPNPTGADAKGEFIELFNTGSMRVGLAGWTIKTTGKKVFSLDGYSIPPGGYLLLRHSETKLSLKNTEEQVSLYDASGRLADQSSFLGQAQEGKSLSRINYGTDSSEHFAWSEPTPGAANKITLDNSIAANAYPFGVRLNHPGVDAAEIIATAIVAGVILAALVVYSLKSDENLSKLFFTGDGGVRG